MSRTAQRVVSRNRRIINNVRSYKNFFYAPHVSTSGYFRFFIIYVYIGALDARIEGVSFEHNWQTQQACHVLFDEPRRGALCKFDNAKIESIVVKMLKSLPEGQTH